MLAPEGDFVRFFFAVVSLGGVYPPPKKEQHSIIKGILIYIYTII